MNDSPQPIVLQLSRTLTEPPTVVDVPGVRLRPFQDTRDIDTWLEIRRRAFARERVGVREWTQADFEREFLAKPWWGVERMWFAEASDAAGAEACPIGTVALADRQGDEAVVSAVHWLAVVPGYRKQGVGRLLMAALETYCWGQGRTEIALETHSKWERAVKFYRGLGYR